MNEVSWLVLSFFFFFMVYLFSVKFFPLNIKFTFFKVDYITMFNLESII